MRINDTTNQEAWLYTIAERKLTCFADRIAKDLPDDNAVVRVLVGDELAVDIVESEEDVCEQPNLKPAAGSTDAEIEWGLGIDGTMATDQRAVLTLGTFKQRLVSAFCI